MHEATVLDKYPRDDERFYKVRVLGCDIPQALCCKGGY